MIFLTGDTHGDFNRFSYKKWPECRKLNKNDFVIILGDFGGIWSIDPKNKEEVYNLKWLDDRPFTTLFIDGNHERFPRLFQLPIVDKFGGKVGVVNNSVFWLKRGQIYEIEGNKIFTFGGARSHDKNMRIYGKSWWPEEQPNGRECNFGLDNLEKNEYNIDYVLTHTAPLMVVHKIMCMFGGDIEDSFTQKYLTEIDSLIKYKLWYFGHFHINKDITEKHTCLNEKIIKLGETLED